MDRELIRLGAQAELARREFFFYCQLKAPDFYKESRSYLVDLCNGLQGFIQSDEEVCIVNIPPRHGKSRTAGNLVEWILGLDKTKKVMTGSYNETLSTMFSKNVRNSIQEQKADRYKPIFSDVFPDVRIKYGDAAMNLWSITYGVYNKEAYVLDVIYTQEPMENTEPMVAKALNDFGVNRARIESNNGGRGFARQVSGILNDRYHSNKTRIKWFHQSQNKVARILSNSTWVMDHIYYPNNWRDKWPDYYGAMVKYQRERKNAHDDAPNAATGVAENTVKLGGVSIG